MQTLLEELSENRLAVHALHAPGFMKSTLTLAIVLSIVLGARAALAQTAPAAPPPPPLWDAQVGASFVGTSGNSDTSSTGIDFAAHRRAAIWQLESAPTALRTTIDGAATAERYLGLFRLQRRHTPVVGRATGAPRGPH